MPLLCCVLTLLPEHLLLASSGVRLLLVRRVCCWLFPPLVCRGSSVVLAPRSPVVTASPLLKRSWQGQAKSLLPPVMLLERCIWKCVELVVEQLQSALGKGRLWLC